MDIAITLLIAIVVGAAVCLFAINKAHNALARKLQPPEADDRRE